MYFQNHSGNTFYVKIQGVFDNMNNKNKADNQSDRNYNICEKSNENFSPPLEIPATPFCSCPETCEEMINTYGTYNIQATANSANDFPAIAQATPPYMKERPLEFFRGREDENPAEDTSDGHCL